MKNNLHIRWMIRRDMAEVLALAPPSVTEARIAWALKQRNFIGMVVERGEQVVGWMIYSLHNGYLRLIHLAGEQPAKRVCLQKLLAKASGNWRRTRVYYRTTLDRPDELELLKEMGFFGWPDGDDMVMFTWRATDLTGDFVPDHKDGDDPDNDADLVAAS